MAIEAAVFTGTDLDQAMQNAAQISLTRAPTLSMFFDRSQEMRLRMNDNVIIDNYHFDVDGDSASTMAFTRIGSDLKADFGQAKEFSLSQQSFKIDQGGENGFKMYERDVARSTRGKQRIADGSLRLRQNAVIEREDDVVSYLASLAAYTTDAPVAADLPQLDNTGANGNAGKVHEVTLGVEANTISPINGAIQAGAGNAGAKKAKQEATAIALVEGLADLRTRVLRRNVGMGQQGAVVGMDPGTFLFLCPPEVGRAYTQALRLLDINNDELNRDVYKELAAFSDQAFQFRLEGLSSLASTALPRPVAATDGYTCYLLTNKAICYGEDEVKFWSQAPNSAGGVNPGPYYSYHQRFTWGRKLVNPECLIRVKVRSAADA